jgi:hypothetical protein
MIRIFVRSYMFDYFHFNKVFERNMLKLNILVALNKLLSSTESEPLSVEALETANRRLPSYKQSY